jgi:chloramphenicol 3-O phosphotransferase
VAVVFLNGTSSAGKTSVARAIQEESATPFLHWGIDALFAAVPAKWGGGRGGPLSRDGFFYDRTEPGVVTIRYGPEGRRMLLAGCAAGAALARAGDLVIDEMLLTPDLLGVWLEALAGLDVLLVGVMCSLTVAEERERARGNEPGLARGHLRRVHAHGVDYDLTVDTSTATPAALARTILSALVTQD